MSATIRETVQAVAALEARWPDGVSLSHLAKTLRIDKSSVSRRTKDAQSKGYLVNGEQQAGKPARWLVGEPLPDDIEILAPPDHVGVLQCCSIGKREYPELHITKYILI